MNKDWSPTLKVETVIERVREMLITPHSDSPLETEIGEQYNSNIKGFNETAVQWVKKYAMEK